MNRCRQYSICCLTLTSLAGGAAATAPLLQSPWRAFDTGDYPTYAPVAMARGDVNADGIADLVVARQAFGGEGISVLLGRDDATFAAPVIYELDFNLELGDVALSDIDGDGDLDAVATVHGNAGTDHRIIVQRNDGSGAFGEAVYFDAGLGPRGILVQDFNGDGLPDVVTADFGYVAGNSDTISVMSHNGLGGEAAGFLAPVSIVVGDNPTQLVAGDVNGDGLADIVVGRTGSATGASVLMNNGDGGFDPPVHYNQMPGTTLYAAAIDLADMDNDGDLDLLTTGATNGTPSFGRAAIHSNNGDGTFAAPSVHDGGAWTYTPNTITAADLNNDGWRDIIFSTPSGRAGDGFNIILSDGAGGFGAGIRYTAAKMTSDLSAWDIDDDGDIDVCTLANDSSVITVHANAGDGTFNAPALIGLSGFGNDIEAGDLDNDGDVDVIAGKSNGVDVRLNNGDGTFTAAPGISTPFTATDLLLADMNNDGWLDIIARGGSFAVALNNQAGGFGPVTSTTVVGSGDVGAFDLDNDGDLDIAAVGASRVALYANAGDGMTFTLINTVADDDGGTTGIAGGDLDGDGNADIVVGTALGITVYLGNGDFTVNGPFPTADYGYPFVLADLDADGALDLAYKRPEPSFGTTEVATMPGYGDGGFMFPIIVPAATGREGAFRVVSDIDVADLDGDGLPDVLSTNNAPNDLCVFASAGDGSLLAHDRYGVGYAAGDSTIADFDGDGRNDVATIIHLPPSGFSTALVISRNILETKTSNPTLPGDVNDDGTVDALDMLMLFSAWGQRGPSESDVNNDLTVDALDLLMLLTHWGEVV